MKRPTFGHGVVVAFVFALVGAVTFSSLTLLLSPAVLLKALITVLGGLYVATLLARSKAKTGRITTVALWLGSALGVWIFVPGLTLFLIAHLTMVWLIRSLNFHTSVLSALLDLALCALSGLAAIAVARHSHSIFLTVWSLFLIQALFVAIPSLAKTRRHPPTDNPEFRFKRALRSAEAAIRRMHCTD